MRDKETSVKLNKIRYANMSDHELATHYRCASLNIRAFRNAQWSFSENGKIVRMRSLPFIVHEMRKRKML